MIANVTYIAFAAVIAFTGWLVVRFRPVPVVLVACSDGKIRELAANDPRISGEI